MKFIELFAGIGGFSLGFERAGMECVGHVEINPYAQKILLKHWPDVPVLGDVRKVKGEEFGPVDLICGGFPCQDISVAGNQKGIKNGTRSSLFDEIIRLSRVLRPRYIVLENIANLLNGGNGDWFEYVLGEVYKIGYDAEWEIISAAQIGANHRRERIWIVAYPKGQRLHKDEIYAAHSPESGIEKPEQWQQFLSINAGNYYLENWERFENVICGNVNGDTNRLDRLKCLGNALVPQIAELIGNLIIENEKH